jgi:Flp pilus assembly protein protease CpaA
MPDPEDEPQLPPGLRFLKLLVILLMITMIVGVITVVWLLVTRMPDANSLRSIPAIPDTLALPGDAVPVSITQGPGWIGVVTQDSRFLIFNPDGSLRQEITVAP